jgi:hypothetical protein
MATDYVFWSCVIGFPIAVWLVAALIRASKQAPQAAATELLGVLVVFDLIVISDRGPFLPFVSGARDDLLATAAFGAFLASALWTYCLLELEPRILDWYARPHGRFVRFPFNAWLFGWAATVVLVAAHFAIFTGRYPV